MVTRGEDIVINRDRDTADLEKGEGLGEKGERRTPSEHTLEAGPMAESNISDETKVTFTEPSPQAEEPPSRTAALAAGPPPSKREEPRRDYRDQVPPDATDALAEWIEGNHTIIEKKMGPGSDVSIVRLAKIY